MARASHPAANPSQIGFPEERGITLSLHCVRNPYQESSKAWPIGRIEPTRILHRHHDGGGLSLFGDCRSLTSLRSLNNSGERGLGVA
jgi:hypothetical protein